MMDIKQGLLLFYKFLGKKEAGSGVNMNANNDKLAKELHKRSIRKF